MRWKRLQKTAEILILILAFFLASRRNLVCILEGFSPPSGCSYGTGLAEIFSWIFITFFAVWVLSRQSLLITFNDKWRKNFPLLIFIVIAVLSLFWTVYLPETFYRILLLVFSSILAAYIGVRYKLEEILSILAWLFSIIAVLSFILVLALPNAGRMFNIPYDGAWRGIYWHRNYFGSMMALGNLIFLFRLILCNGKHTTKTILGNAVSYLLTLFLTIMSRSAGGIILLIFMNAIFLILWAWLKWGKHLQKVHYYAITAFSLIVVIFILLKLDFFLGFLGRDSSLTGRIPLWLYLIQNHVSERPLLGYGFGAIWSTDVRFVAQAAVGWGYPVLIGDNGFLDILLNLGLIGLFFLIVVFGYAFVRAINHLNAQKSLISALPLMIMVYAVMANISLSYILETEAVVWMLIVMVLFVTKSHQSGDQT